MPEDTAISRSGNRLVALVLVCFFLSGVTALIYQILWTRMAVKIIGGAPLAVSIILTIFMAGLGNGTRAAGQNIRPAGAGYCGVCTPGPAITRFVYADLLSHL